MLHCRIGSKPGCSLRLKASTPLENTNKTGGILEGELSAFQEVAVATSGRESNRIFILIPADDQNEIIFDEFFVRGKFAIDRKVNNPRLASEEFMSFTPT